MNKDEILERSKHENVYGDEREREVRTKRDAFSLWWLIIMGAVLMVLKIYRGTSPADIISLLTGTAGLGFLYEGIRLKNRLQVVIGAVLMVVSVYYLYRFCVGLF